MGKQLEIRRANLNPCRGPKKGPLKFCMNQGVLSTSMLLFSNLFGAYSYQVERIPKLFFFFFCQLERDFPGGSGSKEYACNARNPGLIPGLGKSPGKGNGNPLQYSCLENPMDRAWQSTDFRVTRSWTRLSN